MQSKRALRTGIKPTPYQKSFELVSGIKSRLVDFTGENKQLPFFLSLLHDKTNQHRSIYDSYNAELASKKSKSITLENASNAYNTFNSVKFNTSDPHDKFLLHSQFVAWYCKGFSIAPLSDYVNNPVFKELPTLSKYFMSNNKKIFIDLRHRKGLQTKWKN